MPRINLGPTIDELETELERLKASDDPEDKEKALFFERVGLFFWAMVVNDVPPPVMGITVYEWLREIGAVVGGLDHPEGHECEDCEHCLLDPSGDDEEDSIDEEHEPGIGSLDGIPVMPLVGGNNKDN